MRILRQADREGPSAGVPASDTVRGVQTAPGAPLNAADSVDGSVPRRMGLLLGVAAFVIAADVISKSIGGSKMADPPPIRLLGGLLTITLTRNGGGGVRIGTSMQNGFTPLAAGGACS